MGGMLLVLRLMLFWKRSIRQAAGLAKGGELKFTAAR